MEITEFIEATSRLEKYYGKEYTTDHRQIMFEELKNWNIARYKQLISQAIKKCKYLPQVSEIIELEAVVPYMKEKEEQRRKVDCKKCKGSGYIIYKKKIANGTNAFYNEYAAICDCGNAKKYEGWKIKDKNHLSDYYIPTITELGLEV